LGFSHHATWLRVSHPGRKRESKVGGKADKKRGVSLGAHLCSLGSLVAKYFKFQVPVRCVQRDSHADSIVFNFCTVLPHPPCPPLAELDSDSGRSREDKSSPNALRSQGIHAKLRRRNDVYVSKRMNGSSPPAYRSMQACSLPGLPCLGRISSRPASAYQFLAKSRHFSCKELSRESRASVPVHLNTDR
jgi:hypothetical protein